MDQKRCTQCGQEQPISEFRLKSGGRYRASECNACHRAASRAYRQKNLEACRAREVAYARANAERKREVATQWYEAHKPQALEARQQRYAADPDLFKDRQNMRRAKLAGSTEVEFVERRRVYDRDQGICHVCGEHVAWEDFDADHFIPLKEQGPHTYDNVRTSHAKCNRARRFEAA